MFKRVMLAIAIAIIVVNTSFAVQPKPGEWTARGKRSENGYYISISFDFLVLDDRDSLEMKGDLVIVRLIGVRQTIAGVSWGGREFEIDDDGSFSAHYVQGTFHSETHASGTWEHELGQGGWKASYNGYKGPLVSDIPDQSIDKSGEFSGMTLDNYVFDLDNETDEIVWKYSGNTELSVVISNDRVATIAVLDPEWSGSEIITFSATDPGGLTASDTATFTVISMNDPPVVSDISDQIIDDEQMNQGQVFEAINLDEYVEDPDNQDSEITWTFSGNANLDITISDERVATITVLDPEWNGSETITFTASDAGGLSDSDTAEYRVILLGDINEDDAVRSNDAILALRIAAGLKKATDYEARAGDMDRDGRVKANDAIIILRKSTGIAAPITSGN